MFKYNKVFCSSTTQRNKNKNKNQEQQENYFVIELTNFITTKNFQKNGNS